MKVRLPSSSDSSPRPSPASRRVVQAIARLPAQTLVVGVDPDVRRTGIAVASPAGIISVCTIKSPRKLKGYEVVAHQTQQIGRHFGAYFAEWVPTLVVIEVPPPVSPEKLKAKTDRGFGHASMEDIIRVSVVAGATATMHPDSERTLFIPANKWKPTIDKAIYQARLVDDVPNLRELLTGCRKADYSEVTDAAGLAWYGLKKLAGI